MTIVIFRVFTFSRAGAAGRSAPINRRCKSHGGKKFTRNLCRTQVGECEESSKQNQRMLDVYRRHRFDLLRGRWRRVLKFLTKFLLQSKALLDIGRFSPHTLLIAQLENRSDNLMPHKAKPWKWSNKRCLAFLRGFSRLAESQRRRKRSCLHSRLPRLLFIANLESVEWLELLPHGTSNRCRETTSKKAKIQLKCS